ncbi:MAG: hypothetical protein VZR73_16315 [Acutalibacteraceae bacterium]|nr:hypothetical protein [Acutalibacteraceae bacterium]
MRRQIIEERERELKEDYRRIRAALVTVADCPKVEPADRLRAAELVIEIDKADGIITGIGGVCL